MDKEELANRQCNIVFNTRRPPVSFLLLRYKLADVVLLKDYPYHVVWYLLVKMLLGIMPMFGLT